MFPGGIEPWEDEETIMETKQKKKRFSSFCRALFFFSPLSVKWQRWTRVENDHPKSGGETNEKKSFPNFQLSNLNFDIPPQAYTPGI